MKSFAAAALYALTGASAAFGVASASMVKAPTALPNTNSYIVEFDEGMGWREPGSLHRRLYESLKERDVPFVVDHEFDSRGYFVGAAVTLSVGFAFNLTRHRADGTFLSGSSACGKARAYAWCCTH